MRSTINSSFMSSPRHTNAQQQAVQHEALEDIINQEKPQVGFTTRAIQQLTASRANMQQLNN